MAVVVFFLLTLKYTNTRPGQYLTRGEQFSIVYTFNGYRNDVLLW